MAVRIDPITLGVGNCYVVRDKAAILVDCGDTKQGKSFVRALEKRTAKGEGRQGTEHR